MTFTMPLLALLALGCRKRDALAPDNHLVFETSAQGLTAAENSITVKLKLQQPVGVDVPVELSVLEENLLYSAKYITEPATAANKLLLTVPAGSREVTFKVKKVAGALYDGDEKLQFVLESTGAPVLIGRTNRFTLNFAELVATTAAATINGGGVNFGNKVFIDLSANRHKVVNRISWDLGFFCGNDFRVVLNSSTNMMAKRVNKNNLALVTAADTVGFAADASFSQFNPLPSQLPYIDYPNGDLTRTAIAAVSANDADNMVYIVNRGNGIGPVAPSRGWYKIRVLRNASGGYTLQSTNDINGTTFNTVNIAKEAAYNFKYIELAAGSPVDVEPVKKKWDIAWSYFANVTNFGAGEVPYMFQDIITFNRDVQIARVMVATKPFAAFSEADLPTQTFMTAQNAIAADWRSGGGPTSQPAVRTDRYYIVKDGDNNYYKIRFTALSQNGERGYPSYETVLVKKG